MWTKKATQIHAKLAASRPTLQSQTQENQADSEMHMKHLTYNEAHKPSAARRALVSRKVKIYISRVSSNSDDNTNTKSTSTSSPRSIGSIWSGPSPKNAKSASLLSQGSKKLGGLRKREEGSHISMVVEEGTPKNLPTKPCKETMYDVVRKMWGCVSTVVDRDNMEGHIKRERSMDKIHLLRKRIQEGQLERVTRPLNHSSISSLAHRAPTSPPQPPPEFFCTTNPTAIHSPSIGAMHSPMPRKSTESVRIRCHSRNRKAKSATSTIVSIFELGAEALDETRRELQERFKPPFEHLNYPSFSRKPAEGDDEDKESDASFYCAGEQDIGLLCQKTNFNRRLGEGRIGPIRGDFGVLEENRRCGFCNEPGLRRLRNLCEDCEGDFLRRKEGSKSRATPPNTQTLETKPIPPPRDSRRNTLLLQPSRNETLPPSRFYDRLRPTEAPGNLDEENKPHVPAKYTARFSEALTAHTTIIQPKRYSPPSQHREIEIELGNGNMEPNAALPVAMYHREIEQRVKADELERAQSMFKRWSEHYPDSARLEEGSGYGSVSGGEDVGGKEMSQRRDTDFYRVWEELLDERIKRRNSIDVSE